jgi:hypothetical protein
MLLAVWLAESRGGGRLRRGIAWSSLGLVAGTAL